MRVQFEKRKHLMVELLSKIPGIVAHEPTGAYYVFADVRGLLPKVGTSEKLAQLLLEEHGVAVVQGSAFGREGFLRLSFATSEADIKKAMDRVANCVKSLA
jgi:aspartate aminotransferase